METDLLQAALAATGRRRWLLPRGIGETDAEALLACCDRRTAVGRRDYAKFITLLRLGLHRSELAALRLDDIDWPVGELVVRGKGVRGDRLSLPTDVGETAWVAGRLPSPGVRPCDEPWGRDPARDPRRPDRGIGGTARRCAPTGGP